MARVVSTLALAAGLSGCIAAAIPLAASSAIVKSRMDARRAAVPSLATRPKNAFTISAASS